MIHCSTIPFYQISTPDYRAIFSNHWQKYGKIVAVAVAILGGLLASVMILRYLTVNPIPILPIPKFPYPSDNPLQRSAAKFADQVKDILAALPTDHQVKGALESLAHFLISNDHQGEIDSYCRISGKPEYQHTLIQAHIEGYQKLCELFDDAQLPLEKKMEALERLEAERHQCVPARVGLLSDICSSIEEPLQISERLPWLIARYKIEVIRAVINEPHNVHALMVKYGRELGLPASVIDAAKADFHHDLGAADLWLSAYGAACTKENCLDFLRDYINSDLPVRKSFRSYILCCLAEKVPDDLIDQAETINCINAHHKASLKKEKRELKTKLLETYGDMTTPEARAEWGKIKKKIQLKENPFIDASLYAHYQYRLNNEDQEDNKLTIEAIQLFAEDALQTLPISFSYDPYPAFTQVIVLT